jgi:Ubiquitin-activating enzyme E1 FCCH domain
MHVLIKDFQGLYPKLDPRELPDNSAQVAKDCKLTSQALVPLKHPQHVFTPTKGGIPASAYRIEYQGADYWLAWTTDVDVSRGPIADEDDQRYYYTGNNEPRCTTAEMAAVGLDTVNGVDHYPEGFGKEEQKYPLAYYTLGIPNPQTAPTVGTVTGGSGTNETRVYTYTFVTAWGEESGPAPPSSSVTGKYDGSWPLSGMDTPPKNKGAISSVTYASGIVTVTTSSAHWLKRGHQIEISGAQGMTELNGSRVVYKVPSTTTFEIQLTTSQVYSFGAEWRRAAPYNRKNLKRRIYRSSGVAYQYVDEIDASTTTYTDTKTPSQLGETLTTTDFAPPHGEMRGIVSLPNGFFAGFRGKDIYFSEPYLPYAWPVKYRLTADYDVVGLGVANGNLVVATSSVVYLVAGIHPESLSMSRVEGVYPCRSKRSIVSSTYGVAFACDRGIALIGGSGQGIIATEALYDREVWGEQVDAENMISFVLDDRYHGFWIDSQGVGQGLVVQAETPPLLTSNTYPIQGAWTDPVNGRAYVLCQTLSPTGILEWDAAPILTQRYTWKSKKHLLPVPRNLGACRIIADFSLTRAQAEAITASNTAIQTANQAIIAAIPAGTDKESPLGGGLGSAALGSDALADDSLASLDTTYGITFTLYGDELNKHTRTVLDRVPFRLPAGYTADTYEVELSGNVTVHSVQLAGTMLELKGI